ncbi:hypothetical protein OUZ56_021840 [Daphnia magna]|uniref:Uncharacterized protein n=1 Tax=Daphnia magna TaxID=35525 RepID=A0ABR0AUL2_9CRUS|nr:hypothetical protein OUZ56_021840 [Daphnia magna]
MSSAYAIILTGKLNGNRRRSSTSRFQRNGERTPPCGHPKLTRLLRVIRAGTFDKSRNYGRMPGGVKGTLKVKKGRGAYFFIRKGAFDEGDQGVRRCFCRPILSKTMLISANPVTCIGEPD